MPHHVRMSPRVTVGAMLIAVLAVLLTSLGTAFAPTSATTASSAAPMAATQATCSTNSPGCLGIGQTAAWLQGRTVQIRYSHPYFCATPPASGATSNCEAGAGASQPPTGGSVVSPIYVMVPLGFTPPTHTLQCPVAGNCIDHPSTIDLSRLFGTGASNVALPPHSHILVNSEQNQSAWWPVVVIGVTNPHAWTQIVQGRSYQTVRQIRRTHASWLTANVPTNLYLFFQVLGHQVSGH